jgi:hypothetical protein
VSRPTARWQTSRISWCWAYPHAISGSPRSTATRARTPALWRVGGHTGRLQLAEIVERVGDRHLLTPDGAAARTGPGDLATDEIQQPEADRVLQPGEQGVRARLWIAGDRRQHRFDGGRVQALALHLVEHPGSRAAGAIDRAEVGAFDESRVAQRLDGAAAHRAEHGQEEHDLGQVTLRVVLGTPDERFKKIVTLLRAHGALQMDPRVEPRDDFVGVLEREQ